jgi:hypothetical protein
MRNDGREFFQVKSICYGYVSLDEGNNFILFAIDKSNNPSKIREFVKFEFIE